MKAIGFTKCHPADHPEALLDLDVPDPAAPDGHDLLVEVRAVSVNPVDTKRRRSEEPQGGPRILGFDAAGVVRAVGPACTLFAPGRRSSTPASSRARAAMRSCSWSMSASSGASRAA